MLNTDPKQGLSELEAQKRPAIYGEKTIPEKKPICS